MRRHERRGEGDGTIPLTPRFGDEMALPEGGSAHLAFGPEKFMNKLYAVIYPTRAEAGMALTALRERADDSSLALLDAIVANRSSDGAVSVDMASEVGAGAAAASFWGGVVGTLFLAPAAAGKPSYPAEFGLDTEFIDGLRARFAPGASAVLLLAAASAGDRVAAFLGCAPREVVATSVGREVDARFGPLEATRLSVETEVENAAASLDRS
jgi:uncharacterized membrane protein